MKQNEIFEDLFVLELANNHWGKLERGMKIIEEFSQIVRFNNIKAAIKFQFRDVDSFIHKDFRDRADIRYIKKTLDTRMPKENFKIMIEAVRRGGCIPMATPFDEKSVDFCEELDLPLIKIASSDLNDWPLIEKIAKTRRPVIVSTGGSTLKDMDDLVKFFKNRNIPLAINHCVSLYPSEDSQIELNQVDFLRERYPENVIGFSTHEFSSWDLSIAMAYAKGARTFERHIDIDDDGIAVSPYCTLPHQADIWFKAYNKAKEMCGAPGTQKRIPPKKEVEYLDALVRGVYAKRDLPNGHEIKGENFEKDFYMSIPLQKGQMSCREIMNGEVLIADIKKDEALKIDSIDGPYSKSQDLKKLIYSRGF
ncbi:MAG: N-acetylneuraminate synthase family protein [Cyclobacteriaceae bacterium]|nr:N-acetylneuraminate synthase family protein [Cyclobacteriaceae bacterium]